MKLKEILSLMRYLYDSPGTIIDKLWLFTEKMIVSAEYISHLRIEWLVLIR